MLFCRRLCGALKNLRQWSCSPAGTMYSSCKCIPRLMLLLLSLSCCVIQPCCRSDGNIRLEVHGGVSPTPGCRSLPLSGFSPMPFSWTPTQAPQTVLTTSQLGIYTHTHSHKHTHAHTPKHSISPLTHRTDIPLTVTCYTTYILPQVVHFSPIHSCCMFSS